MKIAVTGCYGRVGQSVVKCALGRGHEVVGIDISSPSATPQPDVGTEVNIDHTPDSCWHNPKFSYIQADLRDYDVALKGLHGCEAVIHLAAYPHPKDYAAITHNKCVD